MPFMWVFKMWLSYCADDPQDQSPICYCARCRGEIYRGNICYPRGWQMLCPECNSEEEEPEEVFVYAGYDNDCILIDLKGEH